MRQRLTFFRIAGFLGCTFAVGCAGPTSHEGEGASNQAIVGGEDDQRDPAVVQFEMDQADGYDTCTATFISKTVLLTAAHCVLSEDAGYTMPPNATFRIMLAPTRSAAKDSDYITIDPSNIHPSPTYHGDGDPGDVAILVLGTAVDVSPIPILRTPIDQVAEATPNASVRLVGYGQSQAQSGDNDGAEVKRSLTTTLQEVRDRYLLIGSTGAQGCSGDSGGPALLKIGEVETLIATDTLSATDQACTGGDLYTRLDLVLDFISQYVPDSPDGAPPPADVPDPSDPSADPADTLDGAALYADNCASCHGDEKKGTPADRIRSAINANKGGVMGKLAFLTDDQLAAIAAAP